jgi:catechol 2,3-dioxygenase-like lactoylglutathione lyase family enzyme
MRRRIQRHDCRCHRSGFRTAEVENFKMKHSFAILIGILMCSTLTANESQRPKILGIAYVRFADSDFCKARDFYMRILGHSLECQAGEKSAGGAVPLNATQFVALTTRRASDGSNMLEEIGFATDDIGALRGYFDLHKIPVTLPDAHGIPGMFLSITDPEGHHISFVQSSADQRTPNSAGRIALQIIHAGFVVKDRAVEDHFYKDILGFRPYWHGGMKDGKDDWVALQVPDGTDWVEFMLNISPDADKHTLGVMNHIALGVPDIHAVQKQLLTNGMKLTEEPKIGRDGKWQLNVYDPDDTRVEFMEFTPVEKPCCSEFTGPHPKP